MAAVVGPLVSADWLADRLFGEDIRIIDCRFDFAAPERGYEQYLEGHIPGASYLSLDDHLSVPEGPGRHPLPDPAAFAETLRGIGIGSRHTVVVYDDLDGSTAARLWWMLRSLGHQEVAVLDGGWAGWQAEPRSTTAEIPEWEPADLELAGEWSGVVDRTRVENESSEMLLIDARAEERYRGEIEPIDPVAGHIPGAVNIPYQGNTDGSGRFLRPGDLAESYGEVAAAETLAVYCGSGVTACSDILVLAILGREDVLLYPGSWSDWCTTGGEIATG